ncbi:hypothetical protein [Frigoribacterium sp. Leaf172]|uniref:hypothetical protein n=1 Tax=Frigoribacterium sp. Leaf172 TaxID=1736285 RepID=UPI00070104D1|nr:hypothetical protein [Frigoribacterium sp. Leaf172]KQR65093.1 hypothetical protein ASF89_08470 [Frigoribacterium sp. Leaf172]
MPEPIDSWWARRQTSRGLAVPYPVGSYREAWASFPVLVRQYRPEHNGGIVLSQIPPAADVYLCWLCDAGHLFVATPDEQRHRPGRERRRSSWCPDCSDLARPRPLPMRTEAVARRVAATPAVPAVDPGRMTPQAPSAPPLPSTPRSPERPANLRPRGSKPTRATRPVCAKTPTLPTGTAFTSSCAPPPASAVEAELRAGLTSRLEFAAGLNAVRVARPFFDHLEVWPDIVLSDLRVAIEYDSTGRHGLEHVGRREVADRRKDAALRSAGWEVIRLRTGRLPMLGPHDLSLSGLTRQTVPRLLDELRAIRGPLFVDAYLRP